MNSVSVRPTTFEDVEENDADIVLVGSGSKLLVRPHGVDKDVLRGYGFNVDLRQKKLHNMPQRLQDLELLQADGLLTHVDDTADKVLQRWVRDAKRDTMFLSAAKLERAPALPIWDVFKPHQQVGAAWLASRARGILALSPGLGKTATSIGAADLLGNKIQRILVVCPLTLYGTWKYEIEHWSTNAELQYAHRGFEGKDIPRWTITNPESLFTLRDGKRTLRSCFANDDWDLILVDESLLYKNRKSLRTKMLGKLAAQTPYTWLLSGNPASKYADDLWSQLHLLQPHNFTSYWRFAKQWCVLEENVWGMHVVGNKNPKRLRWYLRDLLFSRNFQDLPDPPELAIDTVRVELHPKQRKLLEDVTKNGSYVQDDGTEVLITAGISMLTRTSQIVSNPASIGIHSVSSAKLDAALELLETNELPAIVWFQYIESLQAFCSAARGKYSVGEIHGSVDKRLRQANIDAFQTGALQILACQLSAGKYGLSLTAAKTVIFHDRSFSTDDFIQASHRVRRLSSTHVAAGYVLHAGHTDELVDEILAGNIRSLSQMSLTDIERYTRRKQ